MTQFLTKFKRIYVCDMLENCFPFFYIFFGAFWFLALGIVCIALQIASIAVYAPYYYAACGIWVGIYFLFVSIVMFYLIIQRRYLVLIFAYCLNVFGLIMSSLGLLVVNILGVSIPCGVNYYMKNLPCRASRYIGFNITLIIMAVFLYLNCVLTIMIIKKRLYKTMEKHGYPYHLFPFSFCCY